MHRPRRRHRALLLALLPACAIERYETFLAEHGQTYVTTDAQASSTSEVAETTSSTTAASTSTAASTNGAEAGQDASSEPDTTTTTSSTTTGDTTAGPEPVCGNGVLEPFGWVPEECDDGNLVADDGCNDTCAEDRTIFVSSILYQAGWFESLYLADALCANMAVQVGFSQPLKYRAWLSDSETHARDRFKVGRGRIVLVNGLVVADSWIDLLAGKLQGPIEVTEMGETYHGGVWTGTTPQGTLVPGATNCDDWTSFSSKKAAYYGYSDRITAEWTLSALDDNPIDCTVNFAVYCLEER